MAAQTDELSFEDQLIDHLVHLGGTKQWQYLPKVKTNEQLWANFKHILENNNQDVLDQQLLSLTEFNQVKQVITTMATPYQAGQFLYGFNGKFQINLERDDGKHVFLTVFDQDQIGAGNTVYQVVNQIERPAVMTGCRPRRFDVTLLINGLPIIQIEEKADGHDAKEALNQIHQYISEGQYSGIFSTLQIVVAMLPHDVEYMANTTDKLFNEDFAFHWQSETTNKPIYDWETFTNQVLSIPMAHKMATNYMILDGTPNHQMLKVMRPYQVYATRNVIQKIKTHDWDMGKQELGYIWHTTGSGKTISSFKAAWLASRLPNVDKVVFLVDRITLTQQTFENYQAYDPDSDDSTGGVVTDTASKADLWRKLKRKHTGIIVTSIFKLAGLADRGHKFNRRVVFIVDEAHRSTAGQMLQKIKTVFPKSAWIGYTGTPKFDEQDGPTTRELFGNPLHIYTIKSAIADRNVLGFKVDFETTLSETTLKQDYLPDYFKQRHPKWTNEQINARINKLTPEDMDDTVSPSVYDMNPDHVKLVVTDILDKWDKRSNHRQFNALLTTHVCGTKASTPMAIMYYDEFQRQNKLRAKPIRVGITFSQPNNNHDYQLKVNKALHRIIQEYNQTFHTSFDDTTIGDYTQNVVARLKRTIDDGQYLDLVIVVNQLLTGFDAPRLNTLYVDRTLKGADLIQAYSRTNRIYDFQSKPFGHIVNYRWPAHAEKLMKQALTIYASRQSASVQQDLGDLTTSHVLAKPFKALKTELKSTVKTLSNLTSNFTVAPRSDHQQEQFYKEIQHYNHTMAQVKQDDQYDEHHPEKLLSGIGLNEDQEVLLTTTFANTVRSAIAQRKHLDIRDLKLHMEHVKDVKVDYGYLNELIAQLANHAHDNDAKAVAKLQEDINSIVDQIDDDKYREIVRHFSQELAKRQVAINKYPVAGEDVNGLIDQHQQNQVQQQIETFKQDWGLLDVDQDHCIEHLIDQHTYGTDDLNQTGELNAIIHEAQNNYRTAATAPKVQKLTKMKYRTQLRTAFTKLANQIKDN